MALELRTRRNGQLATLPVGADPFEDDYDVIVVGLGTAGAVAAITAGSLQVRVLGIERLNSMGGQGTAGALLEYYFGSKGGRYEEIDQQILEVSRQGYTRAAGHHPDARRYVLERTAIAAGVTLRYEALVLGVYVETDGDLVRVRGLQWLAQDGIHAASSRMVIDATGDAEVCALAGCPFDLGRELDGSPQPFSNVIEVLKDGVVKYYYTDSGYVDPTHGRDVSRAIVESSLLPPAFRDWYDDEPRLLRVSTILGVREGRRIRGEEILSWPEYLDGQRHHHPVFWAYSNLDNHTKDIACESIAQQDWIVVASLWGLNFSVPVPLGALVPQGFDGLLVAGRCLSVDHDLAAAVRQRRDMQKCGEAAGAAAALAVRRGESIRALPYAVLRDTLTQTGCLSDGDPHPEPWLDDPRAIQQSLGSDRPGVGIWSAKVMGSAIIPWLQRWLADTDGQLRRNAALALGLLGDAASLPVLRAIVRERDEFLPRTSRRYNVPRVCAAIYLLGKLADREMVDDLCDVLHNPGAFPNPYRDDQLVRNDQEFFFQLVSFAMLALLRIGDRHPDLRSRIAEALRASLARHDSPMVVTLKPHPSTPVDVRFDMRPRLQRIVSQRLDAWLAG